MTQVSGSFHLRTAPASGKQGCLSRVFQGWMSARVYYADAVQDTAATSPDGIRYQDFVAIASTANQSGYKVYRCLRKHSNHEPGATGSGAYWAEVSAEARDAFFTFLIAQQASIQMLTGSQFVIYNDQGEVVAGMGNNDDAYIWAGQNKEFLVKKDGSVVAKNAEITGVINATGGTIDGGDKKAKINFNIDGAAISISSAKSYNDDTREPVEASGYYESCTFHQAVDPDALYGYTEIALKGGADRLSIDPGHIWFSRDIGGGASEIHLLNMEFMRNMERMYADYTRRFGIFANEQQQSAQYPYYDNIGTFD